MIPLEVLKDTLIVSSDAYEVGEITDVRYDPFEWNVVGLRVKAKRSSMKLAAGHGKANILIRPHKFVMNDVMILSQTIERLKESIVPDNNNISSLSSLISAKVVTRDNLLVGTLTTVMINTDDWSVPSIVVRLDKSAIDAMKMKKGLFFKINAEIGTDKILSAADMVHLSEHMDGVRESMTVLE
jgi:sporulation protein YlmC with PRC-barrel domain